MNVKNLARRVKLHFARIVIGGAIALVVQKFAGFIPQNTIMAFFPAFAFFVAAIFTQGVFFLLLRRTFLDEAGCFEHFETRSCPPIFYSLETSVAIALTIIILYFIGYIATVIAASLWIRIFKKGSSGVQ